jgi:histidyl-tRNA synthetase
LELASELRSAGLRVEWFPEAARLPRQFKHADRHGIPVVVVLGPDEAAAGQVAIKDLRTGEQQAVRRDQAARHIRSLLTSDRSG